MAPSCLPGAPLGVAIIDLSCLNFNHRASNERRPPSIANIDRIVEIFNIEGCKREEHDHFVRALVDKKQLEATLAEKRQILPLQPQRVEEIPHLNIVVDCLDGYHRIEAGKRYLSENDRWWVVRLFSSDFENRKIQKTIVTGYRNEKNFPDGEIFRRIRLCCNRKDSGEEDTWWAKLSKTKRKDLRQLLKNYEYIDVFDSMVQWKGLWQSIDLGSHRLLTMRCREEILSALQHVARTWSLIFRNVSGPLTEDAVDEFTVRHIQTLAPSRSTADNSTIRDLFNQNVIFSKVTVDREILLQNILDIPYMIPSLFTFFENLKYLEPCEKIMRSLLPPKSRKSIRTVLFGSYYRPDQLAVEYAEGDIREHPAMSLESDRICGYQQLWLFALREAAEMGDMTPRKDNLEEKPIATEPNPLVWQAFGDLSERLGFKTAATAALKAKDGYRQLIIQLLNKSDRELNQKTIDTICKALKHCRKATTRSDDGCWFSSKTISQERRCGRPFNSDHQTDRTSLFLPKLSAYSLETGDEITTLFRKRDMFVSFLGVISSPQATACIASTVGSLSQQNSVEEVTGVDENELPSIQSREHKQRCDEYESRCSQLLEQIERLKNDAAQFDRKYQANERALQELRNAVAQTERDLQRSLNQERGLRNDLDCEMTLRQQNEMSIHTLKQKIENFEELEKMLRKELESARNEVLAVTENGEKAKQEVQLFQREQQDAQTTNDTKLQRLQGKVEQSEAAEKQLKIYIQDLQTKLGALRTSNDQLEQMLNERENGISEVKLQNTDLQSKLSALETELANVRNEYKATCEALQDKIEELAAVADTTENQRHDAETKAVNQARAHQLQTLELLERGNKMQQMIDMLETYKANNEERLKLMKNVDTIITIKIWFSYGNVGLLEFPSTTAEEVIRDYRFWNRETRAKCSFFVGKPPRKILENLPISIEKLAEDWVREKILWFCHKDMEKDFWEFWSNGESLEGELSIDHDNQTNPQSQKRLKIGHQPPVQEQGAVGPLAGRKRKFPNESSRANRKPGGELQVGIKRNRFLKAPDTTISRSLVPFGTFGAKEGKEQETIETKERSAEQSDGNALNFTAEKALIPLSANEGGYPETMQTVGSIEELLDDDEIL